MFLVTTADAMSFGVATSKVQTHTDTGVLTRVEISKEKSLKNLYKKYLANMLNIKSRLF